MAHQRSRLPAILMLLALLAFGMGFVFANRNTSQAAISDDQLEQLRLAAVQPNSKPAAWFNYGQGLQTGGKLALAVVAYQTVLKTDKYHHDARLQCALCLAALGKGDDYFKFMKETVLIDPKMALQVIDRPGSSGYLAEARFKALREEAVNGSMD